MRLIVKTGFSEELTLPFGVWEIAVLPGASRRAFLAEGTAMVRASPRKDLDALNEAQGELDGGKGEKHRLRGQRGGPSRDTPAGLFLPEKESLFSLNVLICSTNCKSHVDLICTWPSPKCMFNHSIVNSNEILVHYGGNPLSSGTLLSVELPTASDALGRALGAVCLSLGAQETLCEALQTLQSVPTTKCCENWIK